MTEDARQAPILAAFSPRSAGREPVEFGIAASRITGAPLTILAIRQGGPLVRRLAGDIDDDGPAIKHLRLDLQRRHVAAEVVLRDARTVGGGLTAALEELAPQMIALGSTHRGAAGSALLGTNVERVIHSARCPVAVVPQGYRRPEEGVRVIGAAFVPTPEGREALQSAAALARSGSAKLRALAVLDPRLADEQGHGMLSEQHHDVDPDQAAEARRGMAEQLGLKQALAEMAHGVDAEVDILYNDPADGLVAASRHVDLLVMGSRAHGPRRATILGSVSRKVAEQAACPVLILPRGASETTAALISHAEALGPS
jgi:nucleotide-binding universal stress UspA family protein